MANLYDFHRHTHYALVHIGNKYAHIQFYQSSHRNNHTTSQPSKEKAHIIYDNEKANVRYFGDDCPDYTFIDPNNGSNTLENDGIQVDNFLDKLYLISKKDKNTWNEDDKFTIKAVSDFLNLLHKKKKNDVKFHFEHLNFDSFHYAVVVPSEWEEETREDLFRTIFAQANLISIDDHRDRIIISSNIECYFMKLIKRREYEFKRGQNIVMFRRTPIHQKTVLIKLDLVTMSNTRFDFSSSELYPIVKYSTSLSITVDYIKTCIKDFLKGKLSPINDQIIETLVDEIYNCVNNRRYGGTFVNKYADDNEVDSDKFMAPIFIKTDRWNLNNSQNTFLNSISLSDVCAIVGKPLLDNMKSKLFNYAAKKYEYLNAHNDSYFSGVESDLILCIWSKNILECIIQSLNEKKNIITKIKLEGELIEWESICGALGEIVMETVQNSYMYGPPQVDFVNYSDGSLFFNFIPDVIINIDISFNCTLLKCSLFNDNALAQNVFDHSYLTSEKNLPSLQTFYNVSNVLSLTIDKSFIPFADKHLQRIAEKRFFGVLKKIFFRKKDFLNKIELVFNKSRSNKNTSITTTQQKKYIKAFLLMYIIYLKEIISSRLSLHVRFKRADMKVGYAISIEKMLLDTIVGSKEELRELVYTSGLIKKDDVFKKLRINTKGEGVLSSIKQLLKIHFPLKSYFILAQIHEDYIQLTLNHVITSSNFENQQEAIIIEDKILHIKNVYNSLCLSIWNNLVQLSFIKLCNKHCETNHEELFTIKTKKELTNQLKQYILLNILTEKSNYQTFHKSVFKLHLSCGCKVFMTTHDIIDIAFKPFLKDIHSTMSSALINEDIFGRYNNIDYHFSLICFNYNAHFQKIITDILEEEARYFNPMRGIDTVFKGIPASKVEPILLKEFQTGAPHQVYNENYVFSISSYYVSDESNCYFKWKKTDEQNNSGDENVGYHFLKAGDMLSLNKVDKTVYLYNTNNNGIEVKIVIYKNRTSNATKNGAFLKKDETWDEVLSKTYAVYPDKASCVIITAEHIGYSSSIKFSIRAVSENKTSETYLDKLIEELKLAPDKAEVGVPMTLSHF